jgi:superfamily II RNA helicase
MTAAAPLLIDRMPPPGSDPAEVIDAFATWATEGGRALYAHQEDAALALAGGEHVVLATPTGSGKSLVAIIGILLALNRGERAVWTAPIKALVAEKFFDLAALLGPERVGLATGDAGINSEASVLVCTAEIFANMTLAQGALSPADGGMGFACLDEFHYYGDHERGWAWQVPLLTAHRTQFLLMSATLGDMTAISTDLEQRSGRTVTEVTTAKRPTPLYPMWRETAVADTVTEAIEKGLSPVYVVHGSQASAIERAQGLSSLPLTTRAQREAIVAALADVRFAPGFGQTLSRLVRNGVGVHHAGMLPRYRRLVERLAGEGLLPVICGTDTLGVGVNIPIRTVLLTALTKFDGQRVRSFSAREFHQLAGRAGRAGFDPDGHVWAQAPDHVIENEKALTRAGDDPKARRKVTRKQPPKDFIHYDNKSFDRLLAARPEPLVSRFAVGADLVATVLDRPDGPEAIKDLLRTNHDPEQKKRRHIRRAIRVYKSLEAAGVAERVRDENGRTIGVRIGSVVEGSDDRAMLRFAAPLMPFAIEVISTLDTEDPSYHLDVVSVVESVLDDPRQILFAQKDAVVQAEIARMKQEGIPYEERITKLDHLTWPKPLEELLGACFDTYREHHPWVETNPSPKSILRELLESGETFGGFVHRYKLERSEGLLLRYLTDAWRTLDRSLPETAYTDMLEDVIVWLASLIRATDASLLDEWTQLSGAAPDTAPRVVADPVWGAPKAWRTAVRTAAFGWVELLARRSYEPLAARSGWASHDLAGAMRPFWTEHEWIAIDAAARANAFFTLEESPTTWTIRQQLVDPAGSGEWSFTATVDVAEAMEAGGPTLKLVTLGRYDGSPS